MKRILDQFRYLIRDLKRWKQPSFKDVFYLILEQGIWATVFYRISRALFLFEVPFIRIVFRLISYFLMKFSEFFFGAAIKAEADIGPGLYVGHSGMIRVHPKTKAGMNLSLSPGVILGEKGLGGKGAPVIGDDVYIGSGAKVLGSVTIGDRARIGANAVVLKDVPAGVTAVGVPARIITGRKDEKE